VLNLLRSRALKGLNYYQPSDVLQALNNTFQMNYQNDKYFTIWYGVYNRVKRQLIYASAGHPPAVLISGNPTSTKVKKLRTPGVPVGMFPQVKYVDDFCNIEESSSLYIFSDGAYEITQSDGTLWTLEGFIQMLITSQRQFEGKLDQILNNIISLNSKEAFDDDLSIIKMKFD
jgi:sigma-B regulation protein RsbU (phosphoserine phosphatase)